MPKTFWAALVCLAVAFTPITLASNNIVTLPPWLVAASLLGLPMAMILLIASMPNECEDR